MIALALSLLAVTTPISATGPTAPDTAALQFHGFRAGARLDEIDARLRRLEAGSLRCDGAKADRRVSECRGTFSDPDLGGTVTLWISAIDSVAGIITISAEPRLESARPLAGGDRRELRPGRRPRAGCTVDDAMGPATAGCCG